jgi:hypothetical protein
VSRSSFSEETRSKWTGIKAKAAEYNNKLSETVKPIVDTITETASGVKTSYRSSTNPYIKTFRGRAYFT